MQKRYIFPKIEDVRNILKAQNNAEFCLSLLADKVEKLMRKNKSEHITFFYKKKEKAMTDRQVLCIINSIEAAINNQPEELRRELLDIFEYKKGKLNISEMQMLYIILCIWKKEIL